MAKLFHVVKLFHKIENATDLPGKVGGIVALLGNIILAVTSGDTALRPSD